jgi:hypothetical protein
MMRVFSFLFMCEEPIVGKRWEERFWKKKEDLEPIHE